MISPRATRSRSRVPPATRQGRGRSRRRPPAARSRSRGPASPPGRARRAPRPPSASRPRALRRRSSRAARRRDRPAQRPAAVRRQPTLQRGGRAVQQVAGPLAGGRRGGPPGWRPSSARRSAATRLVEGGHLAGDRRVQALPRGPGSPPGPRRGRGRRSRPRPTGLELAGRPRSRRGSRPSRARPRPPPEPGGHATARTTRSSLNGQRSSREPPPRAQDHGSGRVRRIGPPRGRRRRTVPGGRARPRCARAAPSPWTRQALDDHPRQRPAPREHPPDVVEDRAREAGHDADRGRTGRERALPRGIEEPLGRQARLRLLEAEGEVAEPGRLDRRPRSTGRRPARRRRRSGRGRRPAARSGPRTGCASRSSRKKTQASWLLLVLEGEVGVAGGAHRDAARSRPPPTRRRGAGRLAGPRGLPG